MKEKNTAKSFFGQKEKKEIIYKTRVHIHIDKWLFVCQGVFPFLQVLNGVSRSHSLTIYILHVLFSVLFCNIFYSILLFYISFLAESPNWEQNAYKEFPFFIVFITISLIIAFLSAQYLACSVRNTCVSIFIGLNVLNAHIILTVTVATLIPLP